MINFFDVVFLLAMVGIFGFACYKLAPKLKALFKKEG